MHLRILGAHQLESRDHRLTALLVDGRLALDAGSLGRGLTLEEQGRIAAVALTHRHYDHLRDLPTLGMAIGEAPLVPGSQSAPPAGARDGPSTTAPRDPASGSEACPESTEGGHPRRSVEVLGLSDTLEEVRRRLLDGTLYPDFTTRPSAEAPTYRLRPVTPFEESTVDSYTLLPLPVPHGPPTVAYQVTDAQGRRLLFGGDCGAGLRRIWPWVKPHLMVLEVTFSNGVADPGGHLTPVLLERELRAYRDLHGGLPRVVATHFNPWHEAEIRRELLEVAGTLETEIVVAEEDLELDV